MPARYAIDDSVMDWNAAESRVAAGGVKAGQTILSIKKNSGVVGQKRKMDEDIGGGDAGKEKKTRRRSGKKAKH
ncbi:uncharacterized protein BT62DRAFT_778101 [Guyanagaster necrorhizus]|uniref:Uncharacterized protein n=1 Tax=Guyanagaster necrorhizus TaxID=856835 RepID=A0A9P8AV25_9AGAR|nr:uncharacterized protein BT62DRAFT_778101 [Guyanagaster necrorhizus MCA 3950]KAG7447502.1 hypothetical protein BT62DRAFT_778101 [Guyanagaster necrorhizus MCA 3950]